MKSGTIKTNSTNPDDIIKPLYYQLTNDNVKLFWHIPDLKGANLIYYKIKITINGIETYQTTTNNYFEYSINNQNTYSLILRHILSIIILSIQV